MDSPPKVTSVAAYVVPFLSLQERSCFAQAHGSIAYELRAPAALLQIRPSTHPSATRFPRFFRLLRTGDVIAARIGAAQESGQPAWDAFSYFQAKGHRLGVEALDTQGLEGVIRRDVDRTLPRDPWFRRRPSATGSVTSDDNGSAGETSAAGSVAVALEAPPMDATGGARNALANVLQSVSCHVPEVGYCQGMNFVAAFMLKAVKEYVSDRGVHVLRKLFGVKAGTRGDPTPDLQAPEVMADLEAAVFWVLVALIGVESADLAKKRVIEVEKAELESTDEELASPRRPSAVARDLAAGLALSATLSSTRYAHHVATLRMAGLWQPGVPEMKQRIFEFQHLLRLRLPRLSAHLSELELAPDVLVSQWFLTLFAYALPEELLMKAWEACFGGGWAAALSLALAMLSRHKEELLAQESLEDLGMYLRRCQWGDPGHEDLELLAGRGIPWGPALTPNADQSVTDRHADALWEALEAEARAINVTGRELAALSQQYAVTLMRERLHRRTDGLLGRYGDGTPVNEDRLSQAQEESRLLQSEVTSAAGSLMQRVETRRAAHTSAVFLHQTATMKWQEEQSEVDDLEAAKKALISQVGFILKASGGLDHVPQSAIVRPELSSLNTGHGDHENDDVTTSASTTATVVVFPDLSGDCDAYSDTDSAGSLSDVSISDTSVPIVDLSPRLSEPTLLGDTPSPPPPPPRSSSNSSIGRPSVRLRDSLGGSLKGAVNKAADFIASRSPTNGSRGSASNASSPTRAELERAKQNGGGGLSPPASEQPPVDPQLVSDLAVFSQKVEALERRIQQKRAGPYREALLKCQEAELDLQESRDGLAAAVATLNFYLEKAEEEISGYLLAMSPEAKAMVAQMPTPAKAKRRFFRSREAA